MTSMAVFIAKIRRALVAAAQGLGAFMSICATSYRSYNNKKREEYHAQLVPANLSQSFNLARQQEGLVLECFYSALSNCQEVIFATLPRFPEKCFASPHIRLLNSGQPAYRFWFYYRYDRDMTADKMTRILAHELAQDCYLRNIPRLVPLVMLGADRKAEVRIVWDANRKEPTNVTTRAN